MRRVPHRPARHEGRSGVSDACGDGARDLRHGRRARTWREGSGRRHQVVSAFIMPCGFCTAVRRRTRRPLRQLLRDEPPEGHALRRHDATAPRRRIADRDVLDGRARRVLPSCRRPTSSRSPTACRSRNPRCSAARCSRRTARCGTAPSCAAANASLSSPPAASASTSCRSPQAFGASQIIAVDVSDDKLEAAQRVLAPPTWSTRPRPMPWRRVRELTGRRGRRRGVRGARPARRHSRRRSRCIRDGGRMVARRHRARQDRRAGRDHAARAPRACASSARTARGRARDMPEIIRLAAQGIFRPETMVTQRFSLDRGRCGVSGAGARRDRRPRDRGAMRSDGSDLSTVQLVEPELTDCEAL